MSSVKYRENINQNFASRLKTLRPNQISFATRKIKTCFTTLKASLLKLSNHLLHINLHVMKAIPSMLAKPANLLLQEFLNKKKESPVGQQQNLWTNTHKIEWDILDSSSRIEKFNDN